MAMRALLLLSAAAITSSFEAVDDATILIQNVVQASVTVPDKDKDAAQTLDKDAAPSIANAGVRQLILCNAFAADYGLIISVRRTSETLATLQYKGCAKVKGQIEDGDHFDFQDTSQPTSAALAQGKGSVALGSFLVKALPSDNQALLLIIDRQDGNVGFVSHAFDPEPADGAQVAVIDTYNGPSNQKVALHMKSSDMEATELHFNGVATMAAGTYIFDINGTEVPLNAKNGTNYVILRTGTDNDEANGVTGFAQELVVFSAASSTRLAASMMVATALLAFQHWF